MLTMSALLDKDTFECELCGLETPEAGGYNSDIGRLCWSCTLWYEAHDEPVDYPEDFAYTDEDF